jgi:hypothetical protein
LQLTRESDIEIEEGRKRVTYDRSSVETNVLMDVARIYDGEKFNDTTFTALIYDCKDIKIQEPGPESHPTFHITCPQKQSRSSNRVYPDLPTNWNDRLLTEFSSELSENLVK